MTTRQNLLAGAFELSLGDSTYSTLCDLIYMFFNQYPNLSWAHVRLATIPAFHSCNATLSQIHVPANCVSFNFEELACWCIHAP